MKLLLSALLICCVVACKKKEEATKTENAPAANADNAAPAGSGAADTPAAAPAPAQETVDICGTITKEDIEGAVGKLKAEPDAMPPQGSLLGMCTWMTDAGVASVSARPANEYDATVRAYSKDSKDVAGIGEKTVATSVGYLIKVADKPYMLVVSVTAGGKPDPAKSEALAKLAVAKL